MLELWNEHAPAFACQIQRHVKQRVVCTKCGRKTASLGCIRTPCRASPEGADNRKKEAKAGTSTRVKGARLPSEATVEARAAAMKSINDTKLQVAETIREEKASAKRRRAVIRTAAEKAPRC